MRTASCDPFPAERRVATWTACNGKAGPPRRCAHFSARGPVEKCLGAPQVEAGTLPGLGPHIARSRIGNGPDNRAMLGRITADLLQAGRPKLQVDRNAICAGLPDAVARSGIGHLRLPCVGQPRRMASRRWGCCRDSGRSRHPGAPVALSRNGKERCGEGSPARFCAITRWYRMSAGQDRCRIA